jgi:hypothetical protein
VCIVEEFVKKRGIVGSSDLTYKHLLLAALPVLTGRPLAAEKVLDSNLARRNATRFWTGSPIASPSRQAEANLARVLSDWNLTDIRRARSGFRFWRC